MRRLRPLALAALFVSPAAVVLGAGLPACTVTTTDGGASSTDDASTTPDGATDVDGGAEGGTGDDASAEGGAGDGGDAGLPDPNLLELPTTADSVRVVVTGDGWTGFDRACSGLSAPDSYHSVGFERAYVQYGEGCANAVGAGAVAQLSRRGGLVPGLYDIAPEGNVTGQMSLEASDKPAVDSIFTGKLWIKTAREEGTDTVLEASYYGTTKWPKSKEDPTEVDVTVKVAFTARVRTIDKL